MNRILALTAPAMICASLILPAKSQSPGDNDRAKTLLADALKAKNPETRTEGVKALSLVAGQEPFTTRLEAMLNDKDVQVRLAAIEALAELNERGIAALKTALNDQIAEVRLAAATALFRLNDPAGREFLMAVLNGDTKASSGIAATRMREAKRTLQTPNGVMMAAVKTGTLLAPVPYVSVGYSTAQKMMAHSKVSGRAATVLLLGKDSDPEVMAGLRNALTDKDSGVRAAAIQSLALAADPMTKQNTAALFVPLFNDKNTAVRLRAAASYLRLDSAVSEAE